MCVFRYERKNADVLWMCARLDCEIMAQKTSSKSGKKRSKKQQAIFRRRRIVVGIAAIVLISFLVFCLYSLSRGIVAVNREIHHADVYAISRKEVPSPTKEKKSGVPDCDASNVALSLTPAASSFGVGDSMDFTTDVKYDGSSKVGCLVDVSASSVVLTIKSGDDVVWKSNVCPVDTDYLCWRRATRSNRRSPAGNAYWQRMRGGSIHPAEGGSWRVFGAAFD